MEKDKFIQGAIKHPGRVHRYLERQYGSEAFKADGTIKEGYLDKAETKAREANNTSLERAIILAKRLKQGV